MSENTNASNTTLSFLGCVNIAVNLVTKQYPAAKLYEVETHPTNPGQPSPLKDLRAVFQVPGGTAFATMTKWGEFGPIQFVGQPWLGDIVIPWPIDMDIVQADQLMKKAGYTGSYGAVTLREPLYPGNYEPYYIFSMMSGGYVFVGVNDGKVSQHQSTQSTTAQELA
jgi:hypothetical protein